MNSAFTAVYHASVNHAGGALTHQQRVTRLYRQSLKLLFSWAVNRPVFLEEAGKIRARFDANRGLSPEAAKYAVEKGEEEMLEFYHPDRYVMPWMPGGSKFMRNPPPPLEVVYPDGNIPAGATTGTNTPVWPDSVPVTFRKDAPTGYLVDYSKKNME